MCHKPLPGIDASLISTSDYFETLVHWNIFANSSDSLSVDLCLKQTKKARKMRDFPEGDTSKKGKQHLLVLADLKSAKEFKTCQVMLANLGFKLISLEKWQKQNLICILVTFRLSQLSGLNLCKLLEGITCLCLFVRAFFFHSSKMCHKLLFELCGFCCHEPQLAWLLLYFVTDFYICFICSQIFHNFSSLPTVYNEVKVQRPEISISPS